MVVFTLAGVFITSVAVKVILGVVNGAFIVGGVGVVVYEIKRDEKGECVRVPVSKTELYGEEESRLD